VAFDKQETVEIAQRIGAFALSAVQEPDCCTLFLPRKPITRGRIESCERIEQRLDLETLLAQTLEQVETLDLA
jgi:thiamine biosynthesis protein ThiI